MPRSLRSGGNNFTWYCFSSPPTDATSATPGADCSAGLTTLSFRRRSSRRSRVPCRSTSAYWKIHPMLLALGPSVTSASAGSCDADGIQPVGDELSHGRPPRRVLQDHVDERVPHVRRPSERSNVRRSCQRADDRLGDLGLDHQRAARPLHVDDDLRVGDVGNGIQRRRAERVDAEGGQRRNAAQHQPAKADDALDDGGDHGMRPTVPSTRARRR